MKKITTQVGKGAKEKTIYAIVDDVTANILESATAQFRHDFVIMEHESYLVDLRETRRHQSLEFSVENGHEFIDKESSVEEKIIESDIKNALYNAIECLTDDQKWLVNEIYFNNRSQCEVAKNLGISKMAVSLRLQTILKKLKKFLK